MSLRLVPIYYNEKRNNNNTTLNESRNDDNQNDYRITNSIQAMDYWRHHLVFMRKKNHDAITAPAASFTTTTASDTSSNRVALDMASMEITGTQETILGRKELCELWWKNCPNHCNAYVPSSSLLQKDSIICNEFCAIVRRKRNLHSLSRKILVIQPQSKTNKNNESSTNTVCNGSNETSFSCSIHPECKLPSLVHILPTRSINLKGTTTTTTGCNIPSSLFHGVEDDAYQSPSINYVSKKQQLIIVIGDDPFYPWMCFVLELNQESQTNKTNQQQQTVITTVTKIVDTPRTPVSSNRLRKTYRQKQMGNSVTSSSSDWLRVKTLSCNNNTRTTSRNVSMLIRQRRRRELRRRIFDDDENDGVSTSTTGSVDAISCNINIDYDQYHSGSDGSYDFTKRRRFIIRQKEDKQEQNEPRLKRKINETEMSMDDDSCCATGSRTRLTTSCRHPRHQQLLRGDDKKEMETFRPTTLHPRNLHFETTSNNEKDKDVDVMMTENVAIEVATELQTPNCQHEKEEFQFIGVDKTNHQNGKQDRHDIPSFDFHVTGFPIDGSLPLRSLSSVCNSNDSNTKKDSIDSNITTTTIMNRMVQTQCQEECTKMATPTGQPNYRTAKVERGADKPSSYHNTIVKKQRLNQTSEVERYHFAELPNTSSSTSVKSHSNSGACNGTSGSTSKTKVLFPNSTQDPLSPTASTSIDFIEPSCKQKSLLILKDNSNNPINTELTSCSSMPKSQQRSKKQKILQKEHHHEPIRSIRCCNTDMDDSLCAEQADTTRRIQVGNPVEIDGHHRTLEETFDIPKQNKAAVDEHTVDEKQQSTTKRKKTETECLLLSESVFLSLPIPKDSLSEDTNRANNDESTNNNVENTPTRLLHCHLKNDSEKGEYDNNQSITNALQIGVRYCVDQTFSNWVLDQEKQNEKDKAVVTDNFNNDDNSNKQQHSTTGTTTTFRTAMIKLIVRKNQALEKMNNNPSSLTTKLWLPDMITKQTRLMDD